MRGEAMAAWAASCGKVSNQNDWDEVFDVWLDWLDIHADQIAAAHWDGDANLAYGVRSMVAVLRDDR